MEAEPPDSLQQQLSLEQAIQQQPDFTNNACAAVEKVTRGPFADAILQQQQNEAMHGNNQQHAALGGPLYNVMPQVQQCGANNDYKGGHTGKIPSADFALFAQLHLHNPTPAMRQLQRQHTPPHPIFESFPSFTGHNEDASCQAKMQTAAADASVAVTAASGYKQPHTVHNFTQHLHADGAAANPASPQQLSVSGQLSSSSDESSTVLSGSASPTQHHDNGSSARKVSLLSQQIACARSRAASAAAADYEYDYEQEQQQDVGRTNHHANEFMQYLQAQRAKQAAECDAVLGEHLHSSPQRQQQQQQQVIIQVEEASPCRKGWRHQGWRHRPKQQPHRETEQQYQAAEQPQWQQQPSPQQTYQQQQHPCSPPVAIAAAHHETQPETAAEEDATYASAVSSDVKGTARPVDRQVVGFHRPAVLVSSRAHNSGSGAGWTQQHISGCAEAAAAAAVPPGQQQGDSLPDGSQQQALLQQQLSLDSTQQQPPLQVSSSDVPLTALLDDSQHQHQQQQQYMSAVDQAAFPGDWGLQGLHFSSAYSSAWPQHEGSSGVRTYSLDQLPSDAQQLSEVVQAAAAFDTPPVPPKGSRFDDMDSFTSSSLTSAAAAASLASSAMQQQSDRQRQAQRRRQLLANSRPGAGGAQRAYSTSSLSSRPPSAGAQWLAPSWSLVQLPVAGGGQGDGSSSSAAAAAVITDHLDGLLSGLSLLGERSAADVGQELAVACSVHQVMYNHHARYMHQGLPVERHSGSRNNNSSSRPASSSNSSDSLKHVLRRSGSPAALTGIQQLSGWLSASANWLAESAAAACKHIIQSSSSDNAQQQQQGQATADRASRPRSSRRARTSGQVTGSLWQYTRAATSTDTAAAAGPTAATSSVAVRPLQSSSSWAAGLGGDSKQQQMQVVHHQGRPQAGRASRRWH